MNKTQRILKTLRPQAQKQAPIATDMFLPNHSGKHNDLQVGRLRAESIEGTYRSPGNDGEIIFNDEGILAGQPAMIWNKNVSRLEINQLITFNNFLVGDGAKNAYSINFNTSGTDGNFHFNGTSGKFYTDRELHISGAFTVTGISNQPHAQTQPTRALNTTYQNTTGHPIIVYGSVQCKLAFLSDSAYIECKTDASSPPTTVRQKVGWTAGANEVGFDPGLEIGFYMVVAADHYYRIDKTESGGAVTLTYWNEVDF